MKVQRMKLISKNQQRNLDSMSIWRIVSVSSLKNLQDSLLYLVYVAPLGASSESSGSISDNRTNSHLKDLVLIVALVLSKLLFIPSRCASKRASQVLSWWCRTTRASLAQKSTTKPHRPKHEDEEAARGSQSNT